MQSAFGLCRTSPLSPNPLECRGRHGHYPKLWRSKPRAFQITEQFSRTILDPFKPRPPMKRQITFQDMCQYLICVHTETQKLLALKGSSRCQMNTLTAQWHHPILLSQTYTVFIPNNINMCVYKRMSTYVSTFSYAYMYILYMHMAKCINMISIQSCLFSLEDPATDSKVVMSSWLCISHHSTGHLPIWQWISILASVAR